MVSPLANSATASFAIIRQIIEHGEYEIPNQFKGTGAPGEYLESLCKVLRNNRDVPDLIDWEVKFHGGNSPLTLLHKEPHPRGVVRKLVNKYGWPDENGHISFRHLISGNSFLGFKVINADNKVSIINPKDETIVAYWEHNVILNTLAAKLRRLILVHGTKNNRNVIYESAVGYWDLNLLGICQAMEDGILIFDFDARTRAGVGTGLRNHGTKWRIRINDIGIIYENQIQIV